MDAAHDAIPPDLCPRAAGMWASLDEESRKLWLASLREHQESPDPRKRALAAWVGPFTDLYLIPRSA